MVALLALCEALTAFASLAFEITAARLVAPYAGMSTDTWAAIIAAFLGALALGNMLAAAPRLRARGPFGLAALACLGAAAAMVSAAVALPAWDRLVLADDPLSVSRVMIFTAVPFIPAGACLGIVTPLLVTAAARTQRPGRAVGLVYAAGAGGSVGGVLAALWLMLDLLGSRLTVMSLAAGLAANAAVLLSAAVLERRRGGR